MNTVIDIINGLRAMADMIEQHQDVMNDPNCFGLQCGYSCQDEDAARQIGGIMRAVGGNWKKTPSMTYMFATKQLSEGVSFWLACDRDAVCKRVVVGTETIPAQPERTVEKVEWRCDEPILEGSQR